MSEAKENNSTLVVPKEWLPQRVAILGAGRSGIAAAKYLTQKEVAVFVSETCSKEDMDFILASNDIANITHEAGGHSTKILKSDLIICSPGIPSDIPILKKARNKGIPVWSEVELAYRQSTAPFLAVTGSTGKSTTVCLLGSILDAAGISNTVAGNIGLPLISSAPEIPPQGKVVAEISSFQLENIDLFHPRVAAVLNLQKNHLDRYENEEAYYNAKKIITLNMTVADTIVLNANDERCVEWAETLHDKMHVIFYGRNSAYFECVWCNGSEMFHKSDNNETPIGDIGAMKIQGEHNRDNACAAAAIAYAAGIEVESIIAGICSFTGLPHRLEFVREINRITYYNDSKATTAESVACAVNAFHANVHLIAGGKDKGCDFSIIRESIRQKVKSVSLIGEAAGRISKEWKGLTEINRAETLEEALDLISSKAGEGDVVILSPGCSSFDMFSSFEDRGMIFKKLVHDLNEKE
ncbi:MAG: UDP-N-acetylmuramoyl-L-alanine--D-glutamate ligase [bacterium]|nr:UDP-N-acetylmuramoyl-L-alanine--D-glutamate ligase [bacterium]